MKSAEQRFWSKVNKRGPIPQHSPALGECWIWTRALDIGGYGRFWLRGKTIQAHHFTVLKHVCGGLLVLHRCDNRKCVNPAHLFLGTAKDNTQDMIRKGRANQRPGWEAMMRVRVVHRGESNHKSKLCERDVIAIRNSPKRHGHMSALARTYGVTQESIRGIVNMKSWKHVAARDNLKELV